MAPGVTAWGKVVATQDRVLVTGASGFLAKQCIAELIKKGYRVRGTLRRPEAAPEVVAAVSTVADCSGSIEFTEVELTSNRGWDEAARGCRYLLHVASPFPLKVPKDPNELIAPARDGTLRVLEAAARSGVERCVLTSSTVAIVSGHPQDQEKMYTESDWANVDSPAIMPYPLSKTLAERAAWDFIASDKSGMTLAAINPGLILGPLLDRNSGSSVELISLLLRGAYPAVPRVHFSIADVRDVAALHVAAMENPNAAGQRFICATEALWIKDISLVLLKHFPAYSRKLPTREIADFVVRIAALIDSRLKAAVPELSARKDVSNEKASSLLGFKFRTSEDAIVATAQSLIGFNMVAAAA